MMKKKRDFGLLDSVPPPPKPYTAILPENLTIYHYKFVSDQEVRNAFYFLL